MKIKAKVKDVDGLGHRDATANLSRSLRDLALAFPPDAAYTLKVPDPDRGGKGWKVTVERVK